jgi:hypothetical protein
MKERKGHQVHHFIVSEQTKANYNCHIFLKKNINTLVGIVELL